MFISRLFGIIYLFQNFLLPLWDIQPKIRRVGDRSIVPVKHGSLAPGPGEQVEGGGTLATIPGKLKTVENVGNLCEIL